MTIAYVVPTSHAVEVHVTPPTWRATTSIRPLRRNKIELEKCHVMTFALPLENPMDLKREISMAHIQPGPLTINLFNLRC